MIENTKIAVTTKQLDLLSDSLAELIVPYISASGSLKGDILTDGQL
jgi:hypothetical protein